MNHRTLSLAILGILFAVIPAHAKAPNIVFILADDMGYGDVHALNAKSTIPTPNLDRLAGQGMTFTDAHTPSAVCTPTRYGLMTGRYCWRSRLKRGVLNGYGTPLIEPDRATVASFLGKQGYTCGIVGKWHLGLDFTKDDRGKIDYRKPVKGGPKDRGFHFSHIIPASLDFPPYVYIRDGKVTNPAVVDQKAQKFPPFLRQGPRAPDLVMENCLDDLAKEAVAFLRRQAAEKDKPFFLYFPLTAPHKPVLPHPRFRGKTKLGPYGDFIVQVDWTVGEVLKTIDQLGIAKDTLVIYTSDNGSFMYRRDDPKAVGHVKDHSVQAYKASNHTSNYVFRGTKADIWEGGHHVPFFARWPGKIEAGSKCANTICLTDFFATAAEVVDVKAPKGAAPDSYSFLALLQGKSPETPRPPVIHHSANGVFAIRSGPWKLVLGNGSGGRQAPRGKPFARPYQLYNMAKDISEKKNVIKAHAEVAKRLEKETDKIRGR